MERIVRRTGTVLMIIVVCCIGYFSFSGQAGRISLGWVPFGDKGLHLLAYAAYGFTSFLAFFRVPKGEPPVRREDSTVHVSTWASKAILRTLVSGTLLGGIIELLQPLAGRQREMMDLVANVMGLVVGLAVILPVVKTIGRMSCCSIDKEDDEHEPGETD
ncbi:MAG: antibiotic resistance protein VanZ [Spirochaetales bacterium]|nr:antibiotic resistance protein VanZ [Spirochaetales bacterium]